MENNLDNIKIKEDYKPLYELLCRFREGYRKKAAAEADAFVEELFVLDARTCVLGTGTGELFLGSEQVKSLISDDWQYWGDVDIDCENARFIMKEETAWFMTTGTVKYSFEDTPERYESYVNFVKKKAEDPELSPKQKLAFVNWVLALTYHQRCQKRREYRWPLHLSGVLLKEAQGWKIAQLQFSLPSGDFPDERFENSEAHRESYDSQNAATEKYLHNEFDEAHKIFLRDFQQKLFGSPDISAEILQDYFQEHDACILGPENSCHTGLEQIQAFFKSFAGAALELELDHGIASKSGEISWVTVTGLLSQQMEEELLARNALEKMLSLLQAEQTPEEKLFAVQRCTAYAWKETSMGSRYTWPVRMTAVLSNSSKGLSIRQLHISYPSYWVFEGKIDGEKL